MKKRYDVIVIGGGTSGWIAALAAARQGAEVLLVERRGHAGGALASGLPILGFFDIHKNRAVGGYAQEFVQRMTAAGGCEGPVFSDAWHASSVPLNNAVVKSTIVRMLHEAGVHLRLFSQVVAVQADGPSMRAVTLQGRSGRERVEGRVFVDASGDAEVSHLAGAAVRSSDDLQPPSLLFRLENVDLNELDDYLVAHPEVFYNRRLIPGRKITPDFYRNRDFYLVHEDLIDSVPYEGDWMPYVDRFMFSVIPGTERRAVVVNTLRGLFVDGTDSGSLTAGTVQLYRNLPHLVSFFRERIPGFARCYPADSDPEIQLRETRRIAGDATLTAEDIEDGRTPEDTIALGCYYIDVHSSRDKTNASRLTDKAYGIPYRTLLPGGIEGVIAAGRCISGTKEAAGSFRVMATCMAVGQAAGTAAALAARTDSTPRALDADVIRRILQHEGAILSSPAVPR